MLSIRVIGHWSMVKCLITNEGCHIGRQNRLLYLSMHKLSSQSKRSNNNNNNDRKTALSTGTKSSGQQALSKHVKTTERIKQTTKDVTNITVILIGIGITSVIFVLFKELFFSKSPTTVFSDALKKCRQDPRVVEALGEPIKGRGEMTSRGRARHVSSVEYEANGKTHLRVQFYLQGSRGSATVQCETSKDSARSHFRYLFVQMDNYPNKVIVVEDNRLLDQTGQIDTVP